MASRARLTAGLLRETCLSTPASRLALAAILAAGTLSMALPASAANFNVANDAQLRSAISNSQNGDTITFTANITLTANLPEVQRNLTINGNAFALSGNNQFRGLLVRSGTVAINDLKIANAKAQGGNGGSGGGGTRSAFGSGGGGGGGAGLGGALFVTGGANVSVSNVTLQSNLARGGNGGQAGPVSGDARSGSGGGGGGMFGNASGSSGGAGGGGNAGKEGGTGGGGGGGDRGSSGAVGGLEGGGGGGAGGVRGGGGAERAGGTGGFGGGHGGTSSSTIGGGGGGGGGLGGAILVTQGSTLTLAGNLTMSGNNVAGGDAGGRGAGAGKGFGPDMFLQGNGSFTVAPGIGQTQTISGAIVDETGVAGSGGSWSLVKNGAGKTILTGEKAYSGGTTVNSGTLQGNASSLRGNIVARTEVVFDQTGSGTYAGNMSGIGLLRKTGAGDLWLTGTNTHSGGTVVEGGTVLFASDASLGAAGRDLVLINGTIGTGGPALTINRGVTILNDGGFRVGSGPLSWSGVIGGTGRLVKSGNGELILSGTNTYSGGTTVTGGTLRFTTDANLGAAGTGITLNVGSVGTTSSTPAASSNSRNIALAGAGGIDVALHPFIWSGNISGSGGRLVKRGDGELELTGTNTYTGGTLVERGTLRVASDDKLGTAGTPLELQNNGALRASETFASARAVSMTGAGGVFLVDPAKTLTLSGVVSGAGLTKIAGGTLVLTGANTYTGNTNVNGGTVQGSTGSIRGNIAFDTNAGNTIARSVTFDQTTNGTFAGNITGIGSLTKTGGGTLTLSGDSSYSTGTTVLAGALQGTTRSLQGNILNDATLIFDQAFDGTYAGAMRGSGELFKDGSGKLNLTGNSTVGGTTINAGGFAVNGSLTGNVTLNNGVLSGVGNINGNITQNGGTIDPGNSIGNLTFHGSLTINRGELDFEINPAGGSDRITLAGPNGRLTIRGGTVEVLPVSGTYIPNTTYTVVTTSQGVTGSFQGVTGGFAFLTPTLSYDAFNVYLSMLLAPNAFRSVGQTVNQQAVGGAFDAVAAGGNVGGLVTALANLPTAQGAPALQALSGQPYADFGTLNTRAGQLFTNAVGRQMAVGRGAGLGGAKGVALAEACDVACNAGSETGAPPRFSAWLSGIGSTGSVLGDSNAAGLTYTLGGTAFGIDYRLDPRFLLGIAGGYVGGTQWVNGFQGNGYTDALSVALYGSFTQGGFYADALAGYANANNRMQRIVSIPGLQTGIASGNTNANQFLGQVETGYKFGLGFPANTSISPFGRLQIGSVNQAGFTESGSSLFNLSVAQQTTTSVRTTFGADLAASFDLGGGTPLDIGLRLGWMHEFADTARPITAAFAAAPGAQFTVLGATPQRDSAVVGFSAAAAISDRTSLFVNYEGEVGGGTDNHALRAGFRLTW